MTNTNLKNGWAGTDRAIILVMGVVFSALALFAPEMAQAQTAVDTLEPLEAILESIIGIMTGPIATGVAIVAVAAIGYMWMSGRLEMGRAVAIVFGMILIFGAANIVNALRDSTGFTDAGTIGG